MESGVILRLHMEVNIEMFCFLPEGPARPPQGRSAAEDRETEKQEEGYVFLLQGFPGEDSNVILKEGSCKRTYNLKLCCFI